MFKIEDEVKENKYNRTGVIINKYDNFYETDENEEWLSIQNIKFKEHQIHERWYEILCDSGGCILTCESNLKKQMINEF